MQLCVWILVHTKDCLPAEWGPASSDLRARETLMLPLRCTVPVENVALTASGRSAFNNSRSPYSSNNASLVATLYGVHAYRFLLNQNEETCLGHREHVRYRCLLDLC